MPADCLLVRRTVLLLRVFATYLFPPRRGKQLGNISDYFLNKTELIGRFVVREFQPNLIGTCRA